MSIDAIEMSVARWISIPDNPRQRDTERRARFAVAHHLKKYYPIHRFVYAATIGGEIACKLDGHTRALLWNNSELDTPPNGKVVVLLIEVRSLQEAKSVYDQLDAQAATKRPSDIVFGAARENGFRLHSSLLRSCTFITQLKIIEPTSLVEDPYHLIEKWKPHLLALDSLKLSKNYSMIIGFMLMAVMRDGVDRAGRFLIDLDQNRGIKDSKGADGIEALRSHIEIRRAEGSTYGYDNIKDILGKSWSAYTSWLDGKRVKKLCYNGDFFDLVNQCAKDYTQAMTKNNTPRQKLLL